MDAESLLALVRFHAWANDRILATAVDLSDEQLRRDGAFDHGSAITTIRHLIDVDWSWREFLMGNDVEDTYVWDQGFSLGDLPAIHTFSLEEDARLWAYVEGLDETALRGPLALDKQVAVPRWLIVAHIVSHGTQHRSELGRYLTECGHSPGDLDLVDALTLPGPE
jgi:uncharacterized damage-inducible protein DinB